MANFDNIIQEINTNLPDNNTQAITAAKLRTTLIDLTNEIDTVQDDFETDVNQTISDLPSNLIVDNLNSTDGTKALSAKQGNVLYQEELLHNYQYKATSTGTTRLRQFEFLPVGTVIYNNGVSLRVWYDGVFATISNGSVYTTTSAITSFYVISAGNVDFTINPNTTIADNVIRTSNIVDNSITTSKIDNNSVNESKVDNTIYYNLHKLDGFTLSDSMTFTAASGANNAKKYEFAGHLLVKAGQDFYITITSDEINWTDLRIFTTALNQPDTHIGIVKGTRYKFTAQNDITQYYLFLVNGSFVEGYTSGTITATIETDAATFSIPDDYVGFNQISFKKTVPDSKNILNPSTITKRKYINRTNGTVENISNCSITDYIPVNENGLYFNVAIFTYGQVVGSAVYNSDKTFKRTLSSQYLYQEGDEGCFVRYTFYTSQLSTAQVEVGTAGTSYVPYTEKTVIDPQYLPTLELTDDDIETIVGDVESELQGNKVFSQSIDIDLPDVIYAVRGDTLQLFYQGMIKCVNVENYNVLVSCSLGNQFHRYYEYVCPSDATLGDYNFTLTVKDNNANILGTKTCIIRVVKTPVSPSTNKNVLCIGDSLTAGGYWVTEANRRLKGSGGTPTGDGISNITFVGRLSTTSGGLTANYEGKSGWSWATFLSSGNPRFRFVIDNNANVNMDAVYSNNGHNYTVVEINEIEGNLTILTSTSSSSNTPQASGTLTKVSGSGDETITFTSVSEESTNPLWDVVNNKFSFKYYIETTCGYATGTNIDVVYSLLSWNGLTAYQGSWATILGYIKTFADTLHSEYPNAKLKLMAVQYPSMKLMMPRYAATGNSYGDVYGMLNTVYNMNQTYQEFANSTETSGTSGDAYNTFVEFVNVSSQLDSDYNMPISQKAVNTRNTATEPYANNGVHPGNSGYMQIADVAYRNIVANFCQ